MTAPAAAPPPPAARPPARQADSRSASPTPAVSTTWAARRVAELLARADIRVNGLRPWDVTVHDERFFRRLVLDGTGIGLGDSYMDGWWDCPALDQFFDRALGAGLPDRVRFDRHAALAWVGQKVLNPQTRRAARRNAAAHYDLGNDLFEAMLGRSMAYTCGYWAGAQSRAATLDEAQEAKLDLVCRKIGLRAGQRVLDLGCGWGSFAKFAAERYGAHVVGVNVSREQVAYAREACRGLSVEIRLQDYRDVEGVFDHVVSIGMMEHVGPKNHRQMMRTVARCLKAGGLFLLHTIGARTSLPNTRDSEVVWINRHIFPALIVPSVAQIGAAADGLFVVEDLHNFGADYDPTLTAWFANFDRAWPALAKKYESRCGPRFYRTWKYYLLACAGAFRCRKYQLWQAVLSRGGVRGGYQAVR